jgi:hypothetical protein
VGERCSGSPSPPSSARLRLGEFVGGFGCATTRAVASVIVLSVGAVRAAHAEHTGKGEALGIPGGVLASLLAETGLPVVFGGVGDGSTDAGWACRAFPSAPCSAEASLHVPSSDDCAIHAVAAGVAAAAGLTFREPAAAPPLSASVPQCSWRPPSDSGTVAGVRYPVRGTVINLPSRADRWAAFGRNWVGVASVSPVHFAAAKHFPIAGKPHPANGCTASHILAVRAAFEADPSAAAVLVLEDDAIPVPDWDARFPAIWEWAVAHAGEVGAVVLGPSAVTPPRMAADRYPPPTFSRVPGTPGLLRSSVWLSTAGMIYTRRALGALGQMWDALGDHPVAAVDAAVDFLESRDPDLASVVAAPILVRQANGLSDMEGAAVDWGDTFTSANETR